LKVENLKLKDGCEADFTSAKLDNCDFEKFELTAL
jgi:hypothetical protein